MNESNYKTNLTIYLRKLIRQINFAGQENELERLIGCYDENDHNTIRRNAYITTAAVIRDELFKVMNDVNGIECPVCTGQLSNEPIDEHPIPIKPHKMICNKCGYKCEIS